MLCKPIKVGGKNLSIPGQQIETEEDRSLDGGPSEDVVQRQSEHIRLRVGSNGGIRAFTVERLAGKRGDGSLYGHTGQRRSRRVDQIDRESGEVQLHMLRLTCFHHSIERSLRIVVGRNHLPSVAGPCW